MNCHLSELLAHIIEPITFKAKGSEINSSSEMLARIDKLNAKISNGVVKNKYVYGKTKSPAKTKSLDIISDESVEPKAKRRRTDIRFYGNEGVKTCNKSDEKVKSEFRSQVEVLRNSKVGTTLLPNLSDRMKASYLIDKIEEDQTIKVDENVSERPPDKPIQKSGIENLCIVGSDVSSLFPSIKM